MFFLTRVNFEIVFPYYKKHIIYVILNEGLRCVCSYLLVKYDSKVVCIFYSIYVRAIKLLYILHVGTFYNDF